jgi:hypothetical protein
MQPEVAQALKRLLKKIRQIASCALNEKFNRAATTGSDLFDWWHRLQPVVFH